MMERTWPEESLDFAAAVDGAMRRLGGTDLARRCEANPDARTTVLLPVLDALGVLELDMSSGAAEAAAAARAARAAGAFVCPWPLVQMVSVPAPLRDVCDAVYVGDGSVHRLEHLDLTKRAVCLQIDTRVIRAVEHGAALTPMPLDPFGVRCELGEELGTQVGSLFEGYVTLTAFWVSGALGYVRDIAVAHARERYQFGRRISEFGGVQWRLADIAVAHDSLWESRFVHPGSLHRTAAQAG